jgi:hypothetical protein
MTAEHAILSYLGDASYLTNVLALKYENPDARRAGKDGKRDGLGTIRKL